MLCQHEGCTRLGEDLDIDDNGPHFFYCLEHMRDAGWCPGCYRFSAGIESFEFSRSGYCDECESNPDIMGYPDEDEDSEEEWALP